MCVKVGFGVVVRRYVLTCAEVFLSISLCFVRSITFASYGVCGLLCASKCVVNGDELTKLQWTNSLLGSLVLLLSLGFWLPLLASTCFFRISGVVMPRQACLKGLFDGVSSQT